MHKWKQLPNEKIFDYPTKVWVCEICGCTKYVVFSTTLYHRNDWRFTDKYITCIDKSKAEEYEPFGNEWIKEVSKLPKSTLIEKLKNANIERKIWEDKYWNLADRYNDLLLINND